MVLVAPGQHGRLLGLLHKNLPLKGLVLSSPALNSPPSPQHSPQLDQRPRSAPSRRLPPGRPPLLLQALNLKPAPLSVARAAASARPTKLLPKKHKSTLTRTPLTPHERMMKITPKPTLKNLHLHQTTPFWYLRTQSIAAAVPLPPDGDEFATSQTAPAAVGLEESEHSNDKAATDDDLANPKQTALPLSSPVDLQKESAVEDNALNELIGAFGKLSFSEYMADTKS
ncbi:uncharacterized protein BDV17DRAFT_21047 [Aspergillus undulatus]|uniref:uncharacterized protein n=1 Tax=Aspergillus undulatus TaxID=1810928 RepID=UPI003CCDFC22